MPLRELEEAKEELELPEQVIINDFTLVLDFVFRAQVYGFQQLVTELGYHEELLQHRDHVADAA